MHPYLTPDQLSQLKTQLASRREDLLATIRQELKASDDEHFCSLAEQVHDLGDESVAYLLSDLSLAAIDHHVEDVRAIEAAQLHLAEGSYGICADCGVDIGFARLTAYPTATRCIDCQNQYEKHHYAPDTATI